MPAKRRVHWFPDGEPLRDGQRKRFKTCECCGKSERLSRIPGHGLPSLHATPSLSNEQVAGIVREASKVGLFSFATPLSQRSLVVADLTKYYQVDGRVSSACATEAGRLQLASDILHLRRQGNISIRMSLSRESDRFTVVQHAALERHHAQAVAAERVYVLRALMMNSYFSRTALSEQSCRALHGHTFPFFAPTLFLRPWNEVLAELMGAMPRLLHATNYAPYGKRIMPYADWAARGSVYLASRQTRESSISAMQDLVLFASFVATCSEEVLLSPSRVDAAIAGLPFFGSFRSKEIWLDVYALLLNGPSWCQITDEERDRMSSELLTTGEPGPGPRKLIRWVAGDVATKADFTAAEKLRYADLTSEMHEHFSQRFGITGVTQSFFQFCEAAKAVTDMHCGTGMPYLPFSGEYPEEPEPQLAFDRDVNSDVMISRKFPALVVSLVDRYPKLFAGLCESVTAERTQELGSVDR